MKIPLWAFWEQPLRWPVPHFLVPQTIPTIFSSGIPNPPQMIAGLRPRHCSWHVCAAIACHNNTHNCDVCFFRFPNENYGDRYVLIVSSMKLMYHKGWRTNVLSQILSVTHPPAVGLRSRCRPLTSVSFNYAPSLPPFMLPFRIIFYIYIIKLRMWRDGSRLAALCLGRWKFVGNRRFSLHSVRFGQLLVGSKTAKQLYNSYQICSDHFEDSQYMDPAHTSPMPHAISIDFIWRLRQ